MLPNLFRCCGAVTFVLLCQALSYGGVTSATVTIVHGINGSDVASDESYPVDVNINGQNVIAGQTFRSFSTVVSVPIGMNTIEVSISDPTNAGSNSPIASVTAEFVTGGDYSIFAHLDLSALPRLSAFFNDLSPLAGRRSFREFVRHGAVAPVIDVFWHPLAPNNPSLLVPDVANSESSGGADFGSVPHIYDIVVENAGTGDVLVEPQRFVTRRGMYYFNYLVGSEANGTLEVLLETRGGW